MTEEEKQKAFGDAGREALSQCKATIEGAANALTWASVGEKQGFVVAVVDDLFQSMVQAKMCCPTHAAGTYMVLNMDGGTFDMLERLHTLAEQFDADHASDQSSVH